MLIPIYDANQSVSGFSSPKTYSDPGYAGLYDFFWYPADPMCFSVFNRVGTIYDSDQSYDQITQKPIFEA